MTSFRWLGLAGVCLTITASGVAWAEEAQDPGPPTSKVVAAQDDDERREEIADPLGAHGDGLPEVADPRASVWIENPYAPHHTSGTIVRLGTAVGYLYHEPLNALAIGATLAVGQRFNRFTVQSELDYLAIQSLDGLSTRLGTATRVALVGQLDVIRLGSNVVGPNSMAALYVEGGGGVAWNHWAQPGWREPARDVPTDTKRVEGQVGLGVTLDHRLQEPTVFPRRVSWSLGWRVALTPGGGDMTTVCRGVTCRVAQPMPDNTLVERSMLFQSNLAMTW